MVPKCRANCAISAMSLLTRGGHKRPPPSPQSAATQICCDSSLFSFFLSQYVFVRVSVYLLHGERKKILRVLLWFFCAFCGDSLCACAWPQRHFMQLSHPIASSAAASPSPLSSAGGGQRGQVQGSRLPIGRGGLIVSVGWFQELLHSFIFR